MHSPEHIGSSPFHLWWLAFRPKTLPASIAPLLLGNTLAWLSSEFSWIVMAVSLACAILLQIGVNLANDYFDYQKGVDGEGRLGPVRVTQAGLIAPERVRNAMLLMIVLSAILGVALIARGGEVIFWLGLASIAALLGYSGGPYPFASHGLGEVVVFLFFGLVAVAGSFYVQTGYFSAQVWMSGVQAGLLAAAILLVNNIRDIATDQPAGKMTIAVRLGRDKAIMLYQVLLCLPFILVGVEIVFKIAPLPVLLVYGLLPYAFRIARRISQTRGEKLNVMLGQTAKFTLLFCLLKSLGLIVSQWT